MVGTVTVCRALRQPCHAITADGAMHNLSSFLDGTGVLPTVRAHLFRSML